mmetsp:Transcript_14024/g.25320  ORF Transcript_14024/g.25320 Transcript_14024/m.25320 type:complete len:222 (-) Transcript_14024:206-871(-)
MYRQITLEIEDVQAENQNEREQMLETTRDLSRALKFKDLVLDNFVPRALIQNFSNRCYWDEETDEWKLGPVDVKEESLTKRPKSAKAGHLQPITEYARLSAQLADSNVRFKGFNIMQMELIRPKRTTRDYIVDDEEEEHFEHAADEYAVEPAGDYGGAYTDREAASRYNDIDQEAAYRQHGSNITGHAAYDIDDASGYPIDHHHHTPYGGQNNAGAAMYDY